MRKILISIVGKTSIYIGGAASLDFPTNSAAKQTAYKIPEKEKVGAQFLFCS